MDCEVGAIVIDGKLTGQTDVARCVCVPMRLDKLEHALFSGCLLRLAFSDNLSIHRIEDRNEDRLRRDEPYVWCRAWCRCTTKRPTASTPAAHPLADAAPTSRATTGTPGATDR